MGGAKQILTAREYRSLCSRGQGFTTRSLETSWKDTFGRPVGSKTAGSFSDPELCAGCWKKGNCQRYPNVVHKITERIARVVSTWCRGRGNSGSAAETEYLSVWSLTPKAIGTGTATGRVSVSSAGGAAGVGPHRSFFLVAHVLFNPLRLVVVPLGSGLPMNVETLSMEWRWVATADSQGNDGGEKRSLVMKVLYEWVNLVWAAHGNECLYSCSTVQLFCLSVMSHDID